MEHVVAHINQAFWKESTKHDKKLVLRKFIQYAKYGRCDRETPVPPEVSWIKLVKNGKDSRVAPECLLTHEEFEALVKAAENSRDKAMIYVLFEGALRPGELLSMKVGSVDFRGEYCLITVNGKTGLKRLPLVISCRPLLGWLEEHPKRGDPCAPLWCSLATNYKGEMLSYRHFRLIIRRLARKAGLRKAVWPYLFRHSTLTAMAKVLTEARLEQFAGWVHGSKMSAKYVHFSARDLEDAILGLHEIGQPKIGMEIPKLIECPSVRCSLCGLVMDKQLVMEIEEKERGREELIIQRIEKLERVVA
ncbi:MAG: tyrosine-type recombinase/integrase [Candidatus Bathyarchaeia archaeon]